MLDALVGRVRTSAKDAGDQVAHVCTVVAKVFLTFLVCSCVIGLLVITAVAAYSSLYLAYMPTMIHELPVEFDFR